MRLCMTVAAAWHGRVFVLMAVRAVQIVMFRLAIGQGSEDLTMTGAAELRRHIIRIVDIQRAVWLMALQTIFICHEGTITAVELALVVTGEAAVDDLMFVRMAEGAVLLGMFAWEGCKLFTLTVMTG